jgi:hypothetical protein
VTATRAAGVADAAGSCNKFKSGVWELMALDTTPNACSEEGIGAVAAPNLIVLLGTGTASAWSMPSGSWSCGEAA